VIAELVSTLANWLPVGYAFGAGMVATVNPCGFLLLPAYIASYLGSSEENPHTLPLPLRGLQGLSLGLTMTLGFVAVFSTIGLAVALGGQAIYRVFPVLFPVAGLAIGAALAGLGLWLLFRGGTMGIAATGRLAALFRGDRRSAFRFGVAYGVASLSCTLPIFLLVVGSALAAQSVGRAFLQFLSYGLGMGFLVTAVIVGTAFFKGAMHRYLRRLTPYVHEISGIFLTGAGAYLIIYWVRYGDLL
jgi:cytochrome c biogenesis protein CcdA